MTPFIEKLAKKLLPVSSITTRSGAGKNVGAVVKPPTPSPIDSWHWLHLMGMLFLTISLPPVACVVGTSTLWYFLDPITGRVASKVCKVVGKACEWMTRKPEDGFLFAQVILQGVVVPALFFYCFYHHTTHGFSPLLAFGYHLIRIGPYFTNFAYAYTLMHKEGHTSHVGLWSKPLSLVLSHVWNWWIGIFYGVLPSTFAYGHSLNHHRYNNDENDIITTWDRPRDSFFNYLRYLPRFCVYHINVSSVVQFHKEGNNSVVVKMLIGTLYYVAIAFYFVRADPLFALVYFFYPLLEACLLLSCVNWSWHCFLDPDTTNIYASSITILEGEYNTNILNEDFHVVHHQYPGAHWTQHPKLYQKHHDEYIKNKATVFLKTHAFEIFFLAILKKYEVFADKFVDLSGEMSREEIVNLIKTRLRTVSWGEYENKLK